MSPGVRDEHGGVPPPGPRLGSSRGPQRAVIVETGVGVGFRELVGKAVARRVKIATAPLTCGRSGGANVKMMWVTIHPKTRLRGWRPDVAPKAVRESENAGHLDLLGGSCLMFARVAMATRASERRMLAPSVRELADALTELARHLGDRRARQRAADRALDIVRRLAASGASPDAMLTAIAVLSMVATDVMIVAGVDPAQARVAMREGAGRLHVPAPPPAPRMPFNPHQRRPRR